MFCWSIDLDLGLELELELELEFDICISRFSVRRSDRRPPIRKAITNHRTVIINKPMSFELVRSFAFGG